MLLASGAPPSDLNNPNLPALQDAEDLIHAVMKGNIWEEFCNRVRDAFEKSGPQYKLNALIDVPVPSYSATNGSQTVSSVCMEDSVKYHRFATPLTINSENTLKHCDIGLCHFH